MKSATRQNSLTQKPRLVADFMTTILESVATQNEKQIAEIEARVRKQVLELCHDFPIYPKLNE